MRGESDVWSDGERLGNLWNGRRPLSRADGLRRGRKRICVRHVCVLTLDFVTVKYFPVVYVALRHFIILYIFVRGISAPALIRGSYLKDVWMDEDGYM